MALDLQLARAQGPLLSTSKGLNFFKSQKEQEKHSPVEPLEGKAVHVHLDFFFAGETCFEL